MTPRPHALLLIMLMVLVLGANNAASAQTQKRAGLIVQYGDGSTTQRCVSFTEDALTGEELMRRARMPAIFEYSSLGPAVCKVGNDGCNYPADACFCQCQTLGASCTFWNYLQKTDAGWRVLPTGAGARIIQDGTIVAWSWVAGNGETTAASLPDVSIDQICAAPPASTARSATETPLPAAAASTATPDTTAIPGPTATPGATAAPEATAIVPPTATQVAVATQTVPATVTAAMATATATNTPPAATATVTTAAPAATSLPDVAPPTPNDPQSDLQSYAIFGAIAGVLGGLFVLARRRK